MEFKNTRTYKRLKVFRLQAKITGKRQITIPKEIYDYYGLKSGDLISFIEKDGHIIFEPTYYNVNCFICDGSAKIGDKDCFVCKGEGTIDKDIVADSMKMLGYIMLNSFQYKVSISYEADSIRYQDKERYIAYPYIKLSSNEYDKALMDKVRDLIQSRIIITSLKKHFTYGMDENFVIKEIESTLFIEEIKEEVLSWFKEECIIYSCSRIKG